MSGADFWPRARIDQRTCIARLQAHFGPQPEAAVAGGDHPVLPDGPAQRRSAAAAAPPCARARRRAGPARRAYAACRPRPRAASAGRRARAAARSSSLRGPAVSPRRSGSFQPADPWAAGGGGGVAGGGAASGDVAGAGAVTAAGTSGAGGDAACASAPAASSRSTGANRGAATSDASAAWRPTSTRAPPPPRRAPRDRRLLPEPQRSRIALVAAPEIHQQEKPQHDRHDADDLRRRQRHVRERQGVEPAIVVVAKDLDDRAQDAVAEHPAQKHLPGKAAVAAQEHQQAEERQPDQRLVNLRRMHRVRPGRVPAPDGSRRRGAARPGCPSGKGSPRARRIARRSRTRTGSSPRA